MWAGAPFLSTDYFSKHLGVYRPVLAALESLNRAVLTAMNTTKLVSAGKGPWGTCNDGSVQWDSSLA